MIQIAYVFAPAALLLLCGGGIQTVRGTIQMTMAGLQWPLLWGWSLIAAGGVCAYLTGLYWPS